MDIFTTNWKIAGKRLMNVPIGGNGTPKLSRNYSTHIDKAQRKHTRSRKIAANQGAEMNLLIKHCHKSSLADVFDIGCLHRKNLTLALVRVCFSIKNDILNSLFCNSPASWIKCG